jgi:16S rRNA (guanine527-N7)-methyltransferase
MLAPDVAGSLLTVLEEARQLGFLGPGPVDEQIDRSLGFISAVSPPQEGDVAIDLGSGGGLPGLVLAAAWPSVQWILADANQRRTTWLVDAVDRLGFSARVSVVCERAETWGRGPVRATASLVVARGFGPPAVTAECAAPLLVEGGALAVAEPPGGAAERWPASGLAQLNLVLDRIVTAPVAVAVLRLAATCPDRYPRRVGVPAKRPLF